MASKKKQRARKVWEDKKRILEAIAPRPEFKMQPGPQSMIDGCGAELAFYGGAAFAGKAMPEDELVLTPFGWKAIGQLRVGSAVCNPDGTIAQVIAVHPQGVKDIYEFKFKCGSSCRVTLGHLWKAWRSSKSQKCGGDRIFGGLSAKIWTTGEMIRRFNANKLWMIPVSREVVFNVSHKYDLLTVDPYTLGVLLGDGCLSKYRITFSSIDPEIAGKIFSVYPELMTWNKKCKCKTYAFTRSSKIQGCLESLGLLGKKSEDKFIPELYLWASGEVRWNLLRGLMDTDGWSEKSGALYFCSVSERLIEGVEHLVGSLGGMTYRRSRIPKFTYKGEVKKGQKAYSLKINLHEPERAFTLARKIDRSCNLERGLHRTVVSIAKVGRQEAVCITVSNPNGLYITRDFIVTHNSYYLLFEAAKHVDLSGYRAVIFRRTTPQITAGGGLWDTAGKMYPDLYGKPNHSELLYKWPVGSQVKFSHLENEVNIYDHQGAAYSFIGFDELTHFTKKQFFYLLSRNRNPDKFPPEDIEFTPYVRCTMNPDADSWIREFIDWWIDPVTGYVIPERSGVIKWFTVEEEVVTWVDEGWRNERGEGAKSFTFICGNIDDNPIGCRNDPSYRNNLLAQDMVTRERLLRGNWNITSRGGMFNPAWFRVVGEAPQGMRLMRYWDRAATVAKKEGDDPDWTAGALCGFLGGDFYILDVKRFRGTPAENYRISRQTAEDDGYGVEIGIEQEPGSAGVEAVDHYMAEIFRGFVVHKDKARLHKEERAKPWAKLAEQGHVFLVKGEWNRKFCAEAGSFPFQKKDQCFVAGTLVATPTGDIAIERLRVGDLVITPVGIKKILKTFRSVSEVVENIGLIATADHPVFSIDKFIQLDSLTGADKLSILCIKELLQWNVLYVLNLMDENTSCLEGKELIITLSSRLTREERSLFWDCMLLFGRSITERRFLWALLFITKMAIRLTMVLTTWSVYYGMNMLRLCGSKIRRQCLRGLKKSGLLRCNGINRKREENGIESMQKTTGPILKKKNVFVSFVKKNLNLIILIQNFVRIIAGTNTDAEIIEKRLKKNVNVAENFLRQKYLRESQESCAVNVFNVEVADAHCYYANGILVGNCDAVSGAYKLLTQMVKVFVRDLPEPAKMDIAWDKVAAYSSLHYGAMVQKKDLSVWCVVALWDNVKRCLYIYDSWSLGRLIPSQLALMLKTKMQLGKYECEKILCNDMMDNDAAHVRSPRVLCNKELRELKCDTSIKEAIHFDAYGAIVAGNQLLGENRMFFDLKCKDVLRQMAQWKIENNKVGELDCGYAEALCIIISELKKKQVLERLVPKRGDYVKDGVHGTAILEDVEERAEYEEADFYKEVTK